MKQINLKANIYGNMMFSWGRVFSKSFSLSREDFYALNYNIGELIKVNAIDDNENIIDSSIFEVDDKVFYSKFTPPNNCYIQFKFLCK